MGKTKYTDDEIRAILQEVQKVKTNLTSQALSELEYQIVFKALIENIIHSPIGANVPINIPGNVVDSTAPQILGNNMSFIGLLRKAKFQTHPDIVLLATYYLTQVTNEREAVNSEDIDDMYGKALLKKSSNTSQMINQNRKKDLMMEFEKINGKQTYKITLGGIEYVNERIQNGN